MHRLFPALALLVSCSSAPDTNIRNLTAEIAVAPEIVDFGDVAVLEPAVEQVFITNVGKRDLEVDLTLEGGRGAYELAETEAVIAADESLSIGIQFLPESFFDYEATLTIESNDEETPVYTVLIQGTGVDAARPDIDVQPAVLDFDYVDAGVPLIDIVQIHNLGTADLHISSAVKDGSSAFELTTDPSNSTIAPGSATPMIITYNPVNSDGDSGQIVLQSDDIDEEEVTITLLGNGGGNFNYPVAVIDCPGTLGLIDFVGLDGSASYDPDGNEPLDYIWLLTQKPQGSEGYITNLITDSTDLWADIAGDYEVQLQVVNRIGVTSPPTWCFIPAIPQDDLHVELTWDTVNVDLDLHLLNDDDGDGLVEIFDSPLDCNFCNKNPSWGVGGAADDPRLDLDDRSDGPENTNIETPADGDYFIKVHYFDSAGGPPTTATVTVYSYGVVVFSQQQLINWDDVWHVGQVGWPSGTVLADGTVDRAPIRGCY